MGIDWLAGAGPMLVWVVVLSFVFLECAVIIGLFLPGDSLLFVAGVILAGHGAEMSAWWLSFVALGVAIVGNMVGYTLGDRGVARLAQRRGARILTRANLNRARDYLDRRGMFAIIAARWIPWIRTLAPLIAGAAGMNRNRFAAATAVGAVLWVPTLVLLGYYAADFFRDTPWVQTTATWVGITFLTVGTAWGVWRYRQEIRKPLDDPLSDPASASG